MPRPKSKSELIASSQAYYEKLINFIEALSPEDQEADFKPGTMNRNIRDILIHLHHWHLLFLGWYEVGMRDEKPDMPAKGYTWKTMPALNQLIFEKYQTTSLASAKTQLDDSFKQVQFVIESHSDEEMFIKKKYTWTGSTSLGQYLISNTSSHYDWGLKLVRKGRKKIS